MTDSDVRVLVEIGLTIGKTQSFEDYYFVILLEVLIYLGVEMVEMKEGGKRYVY